VDFDKVLAMGETPPFKPKVKNMKDVSNFAVAIPPATTPTCGPSVGVSQRSFWEKWVVLGAIL